MSLLALPNELLNVIITYLETERDINALVQTSRHLYTQLNDYLYAHDIIHTEAYAIYWAVHKAVLTENQAVRESSLRTAQLIFQQRVPTPKEAVRAFHRALREAVRYGAEDLVRLFISHGIGPNPDPRLGSRTGGCRPALHDAIRSGHDRIVLLLMSAGADPYLTQWGVNALDIAVQSQHVPITWHLLEMGVDPHRAGHYPLCIAATRGSELIVQLLLKKGVDPNAEVMPRRQDRPLHYAVRAGHEPVVRLLLEQGADPDAVSASAQTPLYMAAENGRVGIVNLLLERGADPNRVAYQGTALDVARAAWRQVEDKTRHEAVIRILGG
ncbi:hypothetical protein N7474_004123 [Penicillium riverlandense]|uniref:uncharacterized protein n=1 Tax=Penicillium riverlandense TaxID=1903569 RepID=UPI002549657E|nr:uncharacterized protein N7474_004123 [Penicillium riverlandense]KAJ5818532.1 hypothetical protein N7474_004123 [Penicillium riverlandense]